MEDDPRTLVYQETLRVGKRKRLLKQYARIAAWGIGLYVLFAVVLFPPSTCGCGGAKVYRIVCQSNMKQLGLALSQYEQDSDGELPPISQAGGKATWRETLYPYVKSIGVYRCPDNRAESRADAPDNLPKSYGANALNWKGGTPVGQSIAVVDMDGYAGAGWNVISPAFLPKTGRELRTHKPDHAFYEHPAGPVNFLFSDGHVKSLPPMNTLTPVNLWTRDNAPFTGQDLSNARAILQHAQDE